MVILEAFLGKGLETFEGCFGKIQCQEREAVRQRKIRVYMRKEAVGDEGEGNIRERQGKCRYGGINCG